MDKVLEHVKAMDIVTSEMMDLLYKYFGTGQILTDDTMNDAIDKYNAELKGA